ncbi:hypothetical protein IQ255_00035 [Pleurocapsales cyanobacterium LEGE 10410]|nr:hypothetical protein [Pleurocapsales cyanobacterium LEGE 10410]
MSDIILSEEKNEQSYPPQPRINLFPLLRMAKRNAFLIAIITAFVTLLYGYIDYKKNSSLEYAGSFQLLVEPLTLEEKSLEPSNLMNSKGLPNDKLLAVDYPTILRILTSTDMLSEITEEVQTKYADFNIDRLAENLIVERVSDGENRFDASKIIAINYTEQEPELVQLVLETTAQKYLDYSLDSRKQGIDKGLQFVKQQLPELNQKVARNLDEIQELQEQYQLVEADAKGESLLDKLREIESQQLKTQEEIEEQTQIKNNLESKLGISSDEAITISALRENPNYQSLVMQLKEKENALAIASATFNSNSPQVIKLQEEKQKVLDLLNSERRQILATDRVSDRVNRFLYLNNNNSILLSLVEQLVESTNRLDTLQARQQALARNASSFKEEAVNFPAISRRYKNLQQELEIANRTREQLLVQRDRLQIQASQTQSPWTLVSQPRVLQDSEGNPSSLADSSPSGVVKGLLLGLLLGTGAVILREKMQDVFYTSEDLADATKSSLVLGEIPFDQKFATAKDQLSIESLFNIRKAENNRHRDRLDFARTDGKPDFLNAFKKLYANLYYRYRDRTIRSIAVCSPSPGDGKSTVALYLAKTIADSGKKVLLVDANSFNYQLPKRLVSANQAGDNLFVLIVSQEAFNNSEQREQLMNEFQANYDYVVYDTPALLDSVMAGMLSVNTDGILLVAALGKTKKSLFRQAFEQIETFNLPLLGIVANHTESNQTQNEQQNISILDPTKFLKSSQANTLDAETDSRPEAENSSTSEKRGIKSSNN